MSRGNDAFLAALVAALVGTSSGASARQAELGISAEQTPQFAAKITDARDAKDKRTRPLAYMTWSCNFGVFNLGDDKVPNKIQHLEDQLAQRFGDRLTGHEITVDRYSVYFNNQQILDVDAVSAGFAAVAGGRLAAGKSAVLLVPNPRARLTGSRCGPEAMEGGWFSGLEPTSSNGPIIVEITVRMDGQRYVGRAATFPEKPLLVARPIFARGALTGPDAKAVIQATLTRANEDLIARLGEALP